MQLQTTNVSLQYLLLHIKKIIKIHNLLPNEIILELENLIAYIESNNINEHLIFDHKNQIFTYKNHNIKLTPKEALFLDLLIKNKSRIVTYTEIQNYVWKDVVMTDNSIRSLVRHIRKKISVDLIKNFSKIGYKFQNINDLYFESK